MSHPLLDLQAAETTADQLRHRRERLPVRDELASARDALVRWERRRSALRTRIDELGATIERAESDSHAIDTQRARLEAQLKTVIAPREAEALQHQIATLQERRGELDDAELVALEEQAEADDQLATLLAEQGALEAALGAADEALAEAEADIERELAAIAERLDGLRAAVAADVLAHYDRLRQHFVVAAAPLAGSRCEGCHLDLSAAEVDEVRDAASAGAGIAECPHCGRLLVVA